MSLFGAAFAAPNKGTTVLFWFRSLSTVLIPTENRRNQGLFKAFVWFSSTFKAYLIFKDFSRKHSKFKYFSSLCEPWKPKFWNCPLRVFHTTLENKVQLVRLHHYYCSNKNKQSEYDQEIPQSHTTDKPTAPWGRAKSNKCHKTPERQIK